MEEFREGVQATVRNDAVARRTRRDIDMSQFGSAPTARVSGGGSQAPPPDGVRVMSNQ
jgi:hypothetical protein